MIVNFRTSLALVAGLLFESLLIPAGAQGIDVLSFHGGDVTSNGVNSSEQILNPSNVAGTAFGKVFTTDVRDTPDLTQISSSTLPAGSINYSAPGGQIYGEPLVKTGVTITTGSLQGVHDVVFVTTTLDSLFAIDAQGGNILWKDSFIYNASGNPNPLNPTLAAGISAVPGGYGTETNSQDISPWIGIIGTPVIDGVNGYIYLVAKTREVHGGDQTHPHYVLTLHKVRLADGLDTNTVIADTTLQTSNTTFTFNSSPYVLGTGDGATTVAGQSRIYINAVRHMVRPALELYNGRIYIASGSHGDNQPYHGWILTYDASTLTCNGEWVTTPNGSEGEGGIWQGGGGVVIDSSGNIYFQTGNGLFDGVLTNGIVTGLDANGFPSRGNYGDCYVKLQLDPTTTQGNQGTNLNGWGLKVVDYFSASNNKALDSADEDVGSGGPTLLPDSAGSAAHPHLLLGAGKEGKFYLLDRDNMGKFGANNNVVQSFSNAENACFSVPAYFNGRFYSTAGFGGNTSSWPLTNATMGTSSGFVSSDSIAFPGCSPYLSANGASNSIVWIVDKGTGQLRAYNTSTLAEIWTSNLNATRDALGSAVKFACATPVNGHVYVGTSGFLVAYGLPGTPTAPPAAPVSPTAIGTGPSTVQVTWTDQSNNESGFNVERSTNNVNFTVVGSAGVNQTTFNDSGLYPDTLYYYRVRAYNTFNGISYSAYTTTVSATTQGINAQAASDVYHFDEGSGTVTLDSVGNNGGFLSGSTLPTWVLPGRVGNSALAFSGDTQPNTLDGSMVGLATDLSPILGKTSSLLFWIKTTQVGDDTHWKAPAVTGVEVAGADNDINWGFLDGEGRIGLAVGDSGQVLSGSPINDGQWHHIGLTRDAGTGVCNVYVDGALSNSATFETGALTSGFASFGALRVVKNDGTSITGYNFFNGQLDDLQVYNVVVDAAVIAGFALPPAAPSNLAVTPVSGTELDLSWNDNAHNEDGYQVWRAIAPAPAAKIAQLPADSTTYADTGLNQGATYSYFVRATASAGSADSTTVSATTPTAPITPSHSMVTYLSPNEVDIQWTDNASNETGYHVLRRANNGNFVQVGDLPANSTTFQDTTVLPGTSYDYHIQAYNLAGYVDFAGLSVTTPLQSQFTTYLANYFNNSQLADPSITGPSVDFDHDGVSNLLEYAFNMNPTQSDAFGLPALGQQNGYLTITFTQRIPPTDLIYTVEVSGDLVTWNSGATYTTPVSVTPIDAQTQSVTVRDNVLMSSAPRRFIRVRVDH